MPAYSVPTRRSRWRRGGVPLLAALLVLPALAPALSQAQGAGADSVALIWTAPGDDDQIGTATSYEVRVSNSPITDANWSSAFVVSGVPAPLPSGAQQTAVVRGLTRGTTYYFGIKTTDDASNVAPLSNVVRWDWVYDTAPPAAPTGVTATREAATEVRVRWSPNAEPDLGGYTVYRALSASGPFQILNTPPISATELLDNSIPAGSTNAWYQVTASDVSGNESARSSTIAVNLDAQTTDQVTGWTLEPAYPNPSQVSAPTNIPMYVPAAGPGSAALHIVDSGGRVIHRLDLSNLGPGLQTVVWDGQNQAGHPVAPGVYTAWLVGGDKRQNIKMVRVP